MAKKTLPVNFQQNLHVFEKLNCLQEDKKRNIVIVDYGSLSQKQHDFNAILSCQFLKHVTFHVIVLVDNDQHMPYTTMQNCTVIEVASQFLQRVNHISDHIVTQIMMCFSNGLFKMCRCRRAYYCLSEYAYFPDGFQFMKYTGREHVYCSVLKSVKDFLNLQYHFSDDNDNPTKMNMFHLLENDVKRDTSDNSGKLMLFVHGEVLFKKSVTTLWKELRKFGNAHNLPVSVTTAFPSVGHQVNMFKVLYLNALCIC